MGFPRFPIVKTCEPEILLKGNHNSRNFVDSSDSFILGSLATCALMHSHAWYSFSKTAIACSRFSTHLGGGKAMGYPRYYELGNSFLIALTGFNEGQKNLDSGFLTR